MKSRAFNLRAVWRLLILSAIIAGLGAGCVVAKEVRSGAFTEVNQLESALKRGQSTKADVQRLLGTPSGSGSALFPTDSKPREVRFYQDVEAIDAKNQGHGVVRANMRQQILLVFFEKEVFDGFMWYSNTGTGVAVSTP
jgi:hypothetical protein